MNNITFRTDLQEFFSQTRTENVKNSETALSEGQVLEGKVISAETEGQISVRLSDGALLKARLEPGTAAPQSGERIALTLAEPIAPDGKITLRIIESTTARAPAPTAAPEVTPPPAAVLPEVLSAFAKTLEQLQLPATAKNIAALQEIATAPAESVPLALEVGVDAELPTVTLTVAGDAPPAVDAAPAETVDAPANRTPPAADAAPPSERGASALPEVSATVQPSAPEVQPSSTSVQPSAPDVQPRSTSVQPHISSASAEPHAPPEHALHQIESFARAARTDTPSPERAVHPVVTAAPPIHNGAAVKRAALELPARLAGLERELEREIDALPLDDAKTAVLKERHAEVQTLRESLQQSRSPENRFIYAQIPLELHDRRTTAELYVYKNPKSARPKLDPENAKILLALDLERYGHVETLISVRGRELALSFSSERTETADAISRDSVELYGIMSEVGYKLTAVNSTTAPRSKPEDAMLKLLVAANEPPRRLDIAI